MVYRLFKNFDPAIKTSIVESDKKYEIFNHISIGHEVSDDHIRAYLTARNAHFVFTKKNSFQVSTITVLSQVLLLGFGSYLIQAEQLSVGQLVSAEIIVSGIFISLYLYVIC